ncbi:unnamed protein product [Rotaria sp. Silwood1]|nr:unnamed protein product [Rotaria sp. Silwood1]CAF1607881.1 unnamed protein product [Rotaria sp. Silwood1]CAF3680112.1 unnamed protein product [Rotaria sp. Silwood1]CAF3693975.1 unnamed protein product [Rotaria sp. Silwood1]CAF3724041.1 unnamed protein product [Rotaria sp. Silwood1]
MIRLNYNQSEVSFENRVETNKQNDGHPFFSSTPGQCSLFKLCQEYVLSLGWEKCFFAPQHDRCYCNNCYSSSQPDVILTAGDTYVVPREWAGFGLSVDPALADYHKLWTEWIVTYHGTSIYAAQSILANRQFLIPGDVLLNGSVLGIRPGHIPGKKHIYTSPSIRYSSLDVYSIRNDFTASSGKKYKAQLVLQCRQKPGTFKIQPETVGRGQDPICDFISNDKIEYFTEIRVSLVPYRLLVNLKDI